MTHEQNIALWPTLTEIMGRYDLTLEIDCSFVPMLCYHRPNREILFALGTYGCEAGNVLVGARSNGQVSGCSFLPPQRLSVLELGKKWRDHPGLIRLRTFADRIGEPCRSCDYLDICKGGCHAVARYVKGDMDAPDPDCPWVVEYEKKTIPTLDVRHWLE